MTTTPVRRAILAAAVGLTLTGCGTHTEQTGSTPQPAPSVTNTLNPQNVPAGKTGQPRGGAIKSSTVAGKDADTVATAATATMYRYDTRLDNSPMDATRRARPWLTSDYATAVAKPMPGGGGASWITLAQHDGYTTTSVKDAHDDGAPPDDLTHAWRQQVVTVTPHGKDGWTTPPTVVTVFITLVRPGSSSSWQISGVTTG